MRRVAIEMVDKDDKSVECPCSRLAVFAEVVSPHMHLSSLTHGIGYVSLLCRSLGLYG